VIQRASAEAFILSLPDQHPIEPFIALCGGSTRDLFDFGGKTASRVYRRVVVKPVRTGIGNMAKKPDLPGQTGNNLFQGNWAGMVKKRNAAFVTQ